GKYKEVEERKSLYPLKLLERSIYYPTKPVSLKNYLLRQDKSGIIAEFKRKSPSKGMINAYADVEKVTVGYMQAGASALSVLTDQEYFGGKSEDLTTARKFNYCPILRKDFMVDEYQVIEAKSIGADVILLIAAALDKDMVCQLARLAKSLGMEVLFEIHHEEELEKLCPEIDIVGVNNRNLKTFEVDINTSVDLSSIIPDDFLKISESGISKPETIVNLKKHGFQGFLMGESFMKTSRPHEACQLFIKKLNSLL
ncbi:MAG: indole-3-glycerol phosphate synthase TrpC, partial [Mariniphaga sp.]